MYILLTEEWNLNENLALAVISLYGGHIWDIYQALLRLRRMKENFYLFDADNSSNINRCFKNEIKKEDMISMLRLLAEEGFVPLQRRNDINAEAICKNNVGAVVVKSSLNIGLPENVWNDGCEFGLVPDSQSTRMIIAEYLFWRNYIIE